MRFEEILAKIYFQVKKSERGENECDEKGELKLVPDRVLNKCRRKKVVLRHT